MKHSGTSSIETERLLLRPFRVSDAEAMYRNWASSPEVTKFLTWPVHSSPEATAELLKQWEAGYEDPAQYLWCIEWKKSREAIGSLSVVHIDENIRSMEIGYCIGKNYWHQGIMSEAFRAVIAYLFANTDCNRICAKHDVNNPNSGKVMQKCGLSYEGTLRQAGRNNTGICDLSVYAILRRQFAKEH